MNSVTPTFMSTLSAEPSREHPPSHLLRPERSQEFGAMPPVYLTVQTLASAPHWLRSGRSGDDRGVVGGRSGDRRRVSVGVGRIGVARPTRSGDRHVDAPR